MSQAGYTPISLYYSTTASAVPLAANLAAGELAINTTDGKLYYKSNAGVVLLLASNATSAPVLSFQTSLSGLTPSTATTGVVTLAGTLGVASGGTGQVTLATGALGYGQGTSAHASLAIGTAGQILTVNSGATAPQWSTLSGVAVTTFSAGTTGFTPSSATSGAVTLAGTLATTNGGTGLTSFTSGGVVYASSTSALATGSVLTLGGTSLGVNGTNANIAIDGGGVGGIGNVLGVVGTSYGYVGTTTSTPLVFNTSNTEKMRLDTSGNLGLGTSSISAKLTVSATSADPSLATISNGGITIKGGSGVYLTSGTASSSPFGGWIQASDGGSQAYAMSLNPLGGNVGIGTSSPNKKLVVTTGTAQDSIVLNNTALTFTTATSRIEVVSGPSASDYGTGMQVGIEGGASSAFDHTYLQFYTSSYPTSRAVRMHISEAGNVGIGTTAPASKLEISGNGELLRLDGSANQDRSIYFRNVGGANTAKVFTDGTLSLATNAVTPITFSINSSEVARFTTSGEFLVGATSAASSRVRFTNVNAGNVLYVSQEVATNNSTGVFYQTVAGGNNNQDIGLVVAIQAAGNGDRIFTAQFWNAGSPQNKFYVERTGNTYNANGVYGTISDIRVKQDITNASSQWEDFKRITFRKFRMIDDVEKYGNNAPYFMGPVAQELEEAGMKGLVDTPVDKDGQVVEELHKTVKLSIMYMKGMKALQEAMERIEQLEARITAANL